MDVEIDDDTEFAVMWYIELPDNIGNVLSAVMRRGADPWRVEYRFRYYRDAQAFDSQDVRHWHAYAAKPSMPAEQARREMVATFDTISTIMIMSGATVDRVEINGIGPDVVHKALFGRQWAQFRSAEEIRA